MTSLSLHMWVGLQLHHFRLIYLVHQQPFVVTGQCPHCLCRMLLRMCQFTRTQPIYNRSFSTTKCCRTGCFTQLSSAYFSPCLFTISRHRRKEGRSRLLRLLVVGGINQQKTGIAYNKKQTNKQTENWINQLVFLVVTSEDRQMVVIVHTRHQLINVVLQTYLLNISVKTQYGC